jgi:hypothetical protein
MSDGINGKITGRRNEKRRNGFPITTLGNDKKLRRG